MIKNILYIYIYKYICLHFKIIVNVCVFVYVFEKCVFFRLVRF